ncbi:type II toxin-antitoxin system Phd/YefM family antitoxin [Fodinicola feengrottensis]|uniref:Antitoxin n=2 Tax=Fodinicola feengrottensis TaxID=435914 RepID=A0ABP4RMN8_9ACTN|nr:type II toxin-antitoxin system prevent-host-death family antitoxin [Fodinicola feengrottensis]
MSVDVVYPAISIGIRDLRHDTAALLKRVEEGEAIMITNRGKAVAVMRPLNEEEHRHQALVDQGIIRPPKSGGGASGREIVALLETRPYSGPIRTQQEIDEMLDYTRADRDLL